MMRAPVLALALVIGAWTMAEAAAKTVLRVTLQLPITAPLGQNLLSFKEKVERLSDGEIEVQIYPGAQLFTDKEVPMAVASGQIELGVASLARFAGTIPAVDLFSLPFLFNDQELMRRATEPGSEVRKLLDREILKIGARVLWWQPYGLAVMMTRDPPIIRPEDMQGRKIRTFGKALESFVNHLGGAAVNVSGSRQYLAYERGTVDGGMTGLVGVQERKLHQVMDHLVLTYHTAIEFLVIINEFAWQRLDESERVIITRAALEAEAELRRDFVQLEQEALADAVANGMTVHPVPDDIVADWVAATQPLIDAYIETVGPLGARLVGAAKALRESP